MKFKELKNKFYKEYKKVELSTRSGAGSDETYTPTFVHYEKLYFLKKTFEVDKVVSFGNLQDNTYDSFFYEERDSDINNQAKIKSSSQNWTPIRNSNKRSFSETPNYTPGPPRSRDKKNKENRSDDLLNDAFKTLKQVQERQNVQNTKPQPDIDAVDACASLVKYTINNKNPEERPGAVSKLLQFLTTL